MYPDLKKMKAFIIALISILLLQIVGFPGVAEAASKTPKGTTVAGVLVEGLTDDEIKEKLETEIALWQSGEDFTLRSEYENFRAPKTMMEFDLNATIKNVHNKTKRQLSTFYLKPKNVDVALEAKINQQDEAYETLAAIDYIELDKALEQLIPLATELGSGEAPLTYVEGKEMQLDLVTEVMLPIGEGMSETVLKQLISALDDYTIEPKSPFYFLETIEIHDNLKKSPEELSLVASALYQAILETDFTVVERHSHLNIPDYTPSGTDAFVNYKLNKDLIVLNESEFSYKISLAQKDEQLFVKLETFPNDFTYTIKRENKKKIKPRKLYRYDLTLKAGQQKEVDKGKNGEAIEIHRMTFEGDQQKKTELVSVDVYLPEPKVIAVSTYEKISNDGSNLIGSEHTEKAPEDLVVDNGKGTIGGSSGGASGGKGSSSGAPKDTYLYTKEEAEELLKKFEEAAEKDYAEIDKLNKEFFDQLEKELADMEKDFDKQIELLEKEREKLIAELERIEAEYGEIEEEELGLDLFLEAFEETLEEHPELAEREDFQAFIDQLKLAIMLEETEDEAAEETIGELSNMFAALFEEDETLPFLELLLEKLEEKEAQVYAFLPVDKALVAAKKTSKQGLDYKALSKLEKEVTTLSKDVESIKEDIKKTKDKKKKENLEKLFEKKEEELAEAQEELSEEFTALYNVIAREQANYESEIAHATKTMQEIEEALEEAEDEYLEVQAIRQEYPALKLTDYIKLVEDLIEIAHMDEAEDEKAYAEAQENIHLTLVELFTHFNNDDGIYFLDAMELASSLLNYGITFGQTDGLFLYPSYQTEGKTPSGSTYESLSRDILSHVYKR